MTKQCPPPPSSNQKPRKPRKKRSLISVDYRKKSNLLSRKLAISQKCFDCMCGEPQRVRECDVFTCCLWPYRTGKLTLEKEKKQEKIDATKSETTEETRTTSI